MDNRSGGGRPLRMPWIDGGVKKVLDALFPPRCPLCRTALAHRICPACAIELRRIQNPCQRCGSPLGGSSRVICGRCQQRPPVFAYVIAPYAYAAPLSGLIHQFKYRGRLGLARPLALTLALDIRSSMRVHPRLLVPVPLHWSRLVQRGYNQSLELTKHLSRELNIPFARTAAVKTRRTAAQASLPLSGRRANVSHCFAAGNTPLAESIAIVDDVMTSGETAGALASMLVDRGARHIQVWVMCRTD